MSRAEELIRSTTRAIASAVREVPPLRIEAAGDEPGNAPRAVRRRDAAADRMRGWQVRLVPAAAAVVVAAVAIALVNVRSIKDDRVVNGAASSASATAAAPAGTIAPPGPGGVPPYYAALTRTVTDGKGNEHNGILVGETGTGRTLNILPSPAHTVFVSLTAAADDRTFVAYALTSTGTTDSPTVTGSWYEVRLVPGAADPVRLTHLPIASQPAFPGAGPDWGYISVLSGSGRELAVTDAATSHFVVKVYSVATGRLLHDWGTDDQSYNVEPSLAWINGDRDLVLVSHVLPGPQNPGSTTAGTTIRAWPVKGPASGDLAVVSKIIWELPMNKPPTTVQTCVNPAGAPLVSADGRTFSCAADSISAAGEHLSFRTYQFAAVPTATEQGTADYQQTYQGMRSFYRPALLWTSPAGDKLIGSITATAMSPGGYAGQRVGVISHGRFTPLNLPAGVSATTAAGIAF